MSKVEIKELENIVLEGGGAKGAAYAGAIEGLEEAFQEYYASAACVSGCALTDAKSILDYGEEVNGKFVPQIKHLAGSSSGAVTTFALALGLNSDHANEITEFPLSKLLEETDAGKYRMIGSDGKSKIGSDERKTLCIDKDAKPFTYKLGAHQKVNGNVIKYFARKKILSWSFSAIFAGFWEKIRPLFEMITGNATGGGPLVLAGLPIDPASSLGYLITVIANFFNGNSANNPPVSTIVNQGAFEGVEQDKTFVEKLLIAKAPSLLAKLIFKKASKGMNLKIGWDEVGNLLWDRGMFSAFAVREFIFDIIIYASLNETHFHRKFFEEPERAHLKKLQMSMREGRLKTDFSALPETLQTKLESLGSMTFKEFFDETGISMTLCVSNFSTGEPVYFSEYWTPDFPVLEAVGASMSIPPAMKPVYNAADVLHTTMKDYVPYQLNASDVGERSGKKGDYFDWDQYEIDVVAIKIWLSNQFEWKIDTNTDMSVSSFMPVLRIALASYEDHQGFSDYVKVQGEAVRITYPMLAYHFNAAYKGLLMDGGYRCNIPYNVFRTEISGADCEIEQIDPLLKKTVAIKLDNLYPREWMNAIYRPMSQLGDLNTRFLNFEKLKRKKIGQLLKVSMPSIIASVNSKDNKDFLNSEDLKLFNTNDDKIECYERIATDIIALQERMSKKNGLPWNAKKSLLATVSEGYAYGSENGQIRFLSDHEHIIPLYTYGIDTYDFDLDKIRGLVEVSKRKSKAHVKAYFGLKE